MHLINIQRNNVLPAYSSKKELYLHWWRIQYSNNEYAGWRIQYSNNEYAASTINIQITNNNYTLGIFGIQIMDILSLGIVTN